MIKDLITNKDIRAIQAKLDKSGSISPDEYTLLCEASKSESQIQIACHNIIKDRFPNKALFVQIDNGGAMGVRQKVKKKAEGTIAGMPDCMILIWQKESKAFSLERSAPMSPTDHGHSNNIEYNTFCKKQIFVEFKKIGSKPPTKKQLYWHNFLKEKGESVHFCNNTPYFTKVICKEIEEFLK